MSSEATVANSDLDALLREAHDRYRRSHPKSEAADLNARRFLPGGNTRSVLDFRPFPFRVSRANGALLTDIDGNQYIDFCGNYTAGFLGHSPDAVRRAIVDALDGGWAIGATHEKEAELAELLCERFASMDQVRFTNSGTEANLMAIGTALHVTGKTAVGVFERGYHGGVLTFGPNAAGPHHPLNVPHTYHVAAFNEMAGLDKLFDHDDLGCIVVEAVQGSGGCRPALRRRCDASGVVLILDEVMTSRLAPGGAQERFGLTPDMTTLGKYLGGGMTFGAFGGRRDLMSTFDPSAGGLLTQAGTFNNNVVSISAAIATLRHELAPARLAEVNDRGDRLRLSLDSVLSDTDLPMWVTGMGSMLCIHSSDGRYVELLFHTALEQGLHMARRGFMALSMAVDEQHCEALVNTTREWSKSVT